MNTLTNKQLIKKRPNMCKHFFLIDDDEDELEIFMEALSKLHVHCKCTYAQNAEQALEILNYLKPDVVFVDINMPKINGFECVKKIRAKDGHAETRIVMYSNGVNDVSIEEAHKWGATSCVRKTNSIADLVLAMREILDGTEVVPDLKQRSSN
jgi:DNA-binding NarL/FixJ family response regulator